MQLQQEKINQKNVLSYFKCDHFTNGFELENLGITQLFVIIPGFSTNLVLIFGSQKPPKTKISSAKKIVCSALFPLIFFAMSAGAQVALARQRVKALHLHTDSG